MLQRIRGSFYNRGGRADRANHTGKKFWLFPGKELHSFRNRSPPAGMALALSTRDLISYEKRQARTNRTLRPLPPSGCRGLPRPRRGAEGVAGGSTDLPTQAPSLPREVLAALLPANLLP